MNSIAVSLITICGIAFAPLVAADGSADPLPETWYSVAPWAVQPPVDLARRLAAASMAVNAAQGMVSSYSAAIQAQADIRNRQMAMQTELDSYYLAQREAQERAVSERRQAELKALDQAPRMQVTGKAPMVPVGNIGYSLAPDQVRELGEQMYDQSHFIHGWLNTGVKQRIDSAPNR